MNKIKSKIENFKKQNLLCKKGGAVLFGSDFLASINVPEILQGKDLGIPLFNRSIENINLKNSLEVCEKCIYDLKPSKIFVNIGENDIKNSDFDQKEFNAKYEWLLLNIHRSCPNVRIYIVEILSDSENAKTVNQNLKNLAAETGCEFVNLPVDKDDEFAVLKVLDILKVFIRKFPPSFAEAMGF